MTAHRHDRFAGPARAPRVRLRRRGFSTSEPRASSRPRTSPAPTTCRWICCASTATRSSATSTTRSCWCVAPDSAPRRPRRPCARPAWPTCTSSTAASSPGRPRVSRSTAAPQRWDLERQVRLVAGSIVLTSILGSIAAPKLKWLAAAIGGGLTFAALTNTCAMGMLLSKLPYNRGATCDAQTVVAQLVGSAADQKASDRHDRVDRRSGRLRRRRAGPARRRRLDPDRPAAGLRRRHGRQTGHRHVAAGGRRHQRGRRRSRTLAPAGCGGAPA